MTDPTTVQAALDDAGYRRTGARRSITDLIAARNGPFTAADLVADARTKRLGVGRATVFRTLDVLAELHAVERLDLPTGEHAYVACEPVHHHHVVCSNAAPVATSTTRAGARWCVTSSRRRATGSTTTDSNCSGAARPAG